MFADKSLPLCQQLDVAKELEGAPQSEGLPQELEASNGHKVDR